MQKQLVYVKSKGRIKCGLLHCSTQILPAYPSPRRRATAAPCVLCAPEGMGLLGQRALRNAVRTFRPLC